MYTRDNLVGQGPITHAYEKHKELGGLLFYSVFYALRSARSDKRKVRAIPFGLSVAVAALLALFWLSPMLARLVQSVGGSGC